MTAIAYFTVRAVADRLGLAKTDTVLAWIARGELVAVNVSAGTGRRTWRIAQADLDAFLAGRRAVPDAQAQARRRTRRPQTVTQYF